MKSHLIRTNDAWERQLSQMHWYLVNTSSSKATMIATRDSLAAAFETYLPMRPMVHRKGDITSEALFPGYLFARLAMGAEGSTRIFSTRGVRSVIGNGVRPSPVADLVIHKIRMVEMDAFRDMGMVAQAVEIPDFERGQAVTIKTGPLAGMDASFVRRLDAERCQILLKVVSDSPRLSRISIPLASIK